MARQLSPIKVKIGLKPNNNADYPNFNSITAVQEAGMDWSRYIDRFGTGWHLDALSGHKEEDETSELGVQYGLLMVPKAFADEAITKFPDTCFALTEAEAKDFYDNRAKALSMDEDIDNEILQGIKAKQDLGQTLTQDQLDALDPQKPKRGVKKNFNRYFNDKKIKEGLSFVKAEIIPEPEEPPKVAKK